MEKKPYRLFLCCYIYREVLLANEAIGEEKRKMENKKSPIRTFFILHRETILEAPPRFELGIKVLQTYALPLGYSAKKIGADYEARTRYLHLGKVALYQMS